MRAALAMLVLAALAAAYAVSLHLWHGAARPVSAVVAGAGLLVVGELAFGHARRPPWWLGLCALGAAAVAVVVQLVAALDLPRSIGLTIVGCVAVIAAVWLLVSVTRDLASGDR
jgi:FtsH-binding integral membrane protein